MNIHALIPLAAALALTACTPVKLAWWGFQPPSGTPKPTVEDWRKMTPHERLQTTDRHVRATHQRSFTRYYRSVHLRDCMDQEVAALPEADTRTTQGSLLFKCHTLLNLQNAPKGNLSHTSSGYSWVVASEEERQTYLEHHRTQSLKSVRANVRGMFDRMLCPTESTKACMDDIFRRADILALPHLSLKSAAGICLIRNDCAQPIGEELNQQIQEWVRHPPHVKRQETINDTPPKSSATESSE